jgi:hypothetical protein
MQVTTRMPTAAEETAFGAQIAQERAQGRKIARMFVAACKAGDAEQLHQAAQLMVFAIDGWRLAMRGVARLREVSPEIREAFIPIWVEHKALPRSVGHRPTMAAALRVLMRGDYRGPDLQLFRGTSDREVRRRLYGFSWTTDIQIARNFSEQNSRAAEAKPIVLVSTVPASAILLRREPEEYFDEGEVVVDPYKLGEVAALGVILVEANGGALETGDCIAHCDRLSL